MLIFYFQLHGKELHKGLLGYFSNEELPFEDSFGNVKNIHCSESEGLAEDDESEYYVKNAACFMLFSKINMPLAMKKIQERGRCGKNAIFDKANIGPYKEILFA